MIHRRFKRSAVFIWRVSSEDNIVDECISYWQNEFFSLWNLQRRTHAYLLQRLIETLNQRSQGCVVFNIFNSSWTSFFARIVWITGEHLIAPFGLIYWVLILKEWLWHRTLTIDKLWWWTLSNRLIKVEISFLFVVIIKHLVRYSVTLIKLSVKFVSLSSPDLWIESLTCKDSRQEYRLCSVWLVKWVIIERISTVFCEIQTFIIGAWWGRKFDVKILIVINDFIRMGVSGSMKSHYIIDVYFTNFWSKFFFPFFMHNPGFANLNSLNAFYLILSA